MQLFMALLPFTLVGIFVAGLIFGLTIGLRFHRDLTVKQKDHIEKLELLNDKQAELIDRHIASEKSDFVDIVKH
jgi:hypothetical protein